MGVSINVLQLRVLWILTGVLAMFVYLRSKGTRSHRHPIGYQTDKTDSATKWANWCNDEFTFQYNLVSGTSTKGYVMLYFYTTKFPFLLT